MQFEEFDKKAKEAADHHHPAYDEQAWAKMEKLLNKHLPQKEDKKRRFLFFFLLFLSLAGAGLIIAKPWSSNNKLVTTEQTIQQNETVSLPPSAETDKEKESTENAVGINDDEIKSNTGTYSKQLSPDLSVRNQTVYFRKNKSVEENISKEVSFSTTPLAKTKNNQPVINTENENRKKSNDKEDKTESTIATRPVAIAATSSSANDVIAIDKMKSETVIADKPAKTTTKPVTSESEKGAASTNESESVAKSNVPKNPKDKKRKSNSFFFTLSTGPDVSFVSNNKLGTAKMVIGGGLGYTFNNRFILRTGFYSAQKVYTASPDAYNPPANFYTYYPYLESVDADCKVYEIPISLSYNFSKSAKQSLFATAGISSILMKEEIYNYTYKFSPSGPLYSHENTVSNENKHLFSTITISGGYQRNIGRHISILAEPYVKLPLSGVGYGKVKLNSGGVLFSIGIKPFAGKKEKPTVNQ